MTSPTEFTSGAQTFEDAIAWRASQVEEYSQWIAAGNIYHGNALAYTEGDPVPASNVKAHDYDVKGLVRRPDGWTDPVPGDGIEDEPVGTLGTPAAESNVDPTPDTTAVKHTPKRR